MKHLILVLVATLTVLASVSGAAIAASTHKTRQDDEAATTAMQRIVDDLKAPRPEELTTPPRLGARNGEPVPAPHVKRTVSAQAATRRWIDGPGSHTYYVSSVTGTFFWLTNQRVGYWGTTDGSFPKVGELYYGRVYIANIGTFATGVTADIMLPRNTQFAIDVNNPDRRVVCLLVNFHTNQSTELTGADCDQEPLQGYYGAHFAPSSRANAGQWWISPGQAIVFMFPIYSRTELNGLAASPADCMSHQSLPPAPSGMDMTTPERPIPARWPMGMEHIRACSFPLDRHTLSACPSAAAP
jgi:hypothetical protein